jgi:hypothetical protein
VARACLRAKALVEPVRVAPRELRARTDAEQRKVAERRASDIRQGREGIRIVSGAASHGVISVVV